MTAVSTHVPVSGRKNRDRAVSRLRSVGTPVVVAAALLADYLWVQSMQLDSIEQRTLNSGYLVARTTEHLELTVIATVLIMAIAVPLGIVASRVRARWVPPVLLGLANIGQATPAIGVLVLLTILYGPGFGVAMTSLVAYSALPVLRNTLVGIQQVDRSLIEAARGMGMKPAQILLRIELPLAVPVILAGLRTALVFCVGVATLATFVNAGGLGDIIVNGIKLDRTAVLVTGSVVTASIALLVDWAGGLAEQALRPKGI
ncbi:ABC transporter permease [Streptomyces spongiicola]|uniref:ABC transporter permease n=1 Tax=Streptomyces spongiicola TaxID=1690221 RepID=A0A388T5I9_9ACTN|nr:ABC transporter permease [Streptomyces spongiicola]GBQ03786.1 ABC transporter permease [Streptomyces spongiicola]